MYYLCFERILSLCVASSISFLVGAPSLNALLPVQSTAPTIVAVLGFVKNVLIRHRWARLQTIQSRQLPVQLKALSIGTDDQRASPQAAFVLNNCRWLPFRWQLRCPLFPTMLQDNRHLQLALGAAALVPLIWGSFWLSTGRRHRSGAPSVPYSIPWLGSAPDLGKDPDGFIDRCSCVLSLEYNRLVSNHLKDANMVKFLLPRHVLRIRSCRSY